MFYSLFHFDFLSLYFYSLPSFLKFHRFVNPVESDPLIFRSKVLCETFGFFPLPLSLLHRYSVWINREPFLLYESILLHSNSFPIPTKENPELDPKLTGWCELIHAVMHSSNRNQFSERSWLSCFGESSKILSMTYVVLKGYLYDPIDCVRPAVATEPGEVYRKDSSFLLY